MELKYRFGMFVHWGIYAQLGWHEQYMLRHGTKRAEYEPLKDRFDPVEYDPDEWCRLAKEAGMEYICITAKHHDGFCMWDTKETDYNITKTPYGKDILKMLAEACERNGLALSIYYSQPDAHQVNAYNKLSSHQTMPEEGDEPNSVLYREYIKRQITELMTNYGKIYTLFWDIPPMIDDPSINELVRKLQPDILINDRGYAPGDFSTPERNVPDGEMFTTPTEACQSVGKESWGYRENEDYFTPKFIMQSMGKIMLMGGSYLLNVGPDALGRIPEKSASIVRKVGDWYNRVKSAYGDTEPCSELNASSGAFVTKRGETYFLHYTREPMACGIRLSTVDRLPKRAYVLNDGRELKCELSDTPIGYQPSTPVMPSLHIREVPFDEYYGEVPIVALEF